VDVLRYLRLVFPQLCDAVLECICDESVALRLELTSNVHCTNLANSTMSSSRLACPLVVAPVALVNILAVVQVNEKHKHAFKHSRRTIYEVMVPNRGRTFVQSRNTPLRLRSSRKAKSIRRFHEEVGRDVLGTASLQV
jgi:hypothetical protein